MRPNILFITCDQLRADALGCYGNRAIRTPHIDALAAAGTRFSRMYVAAPVCAPNRGSIATGRWPSVHGLRVNGCTLPPGELTLMECLRRTGYTTYGVGKMHFKPQWDYAPDDMAGILAGADRGVGAISPQPAPHELPFYGFEHCALTEDNRAGPFADYLVARGLDPWADPHSYTYPQHITKRSAWPEKHHQTTWVADRSIEFLHAHADRAATAAAQPFFMWTSFVHPHHPFNPPAPYDTMYNPADMPPPLWHPGEPDRWPERLRKKHFARDGQHHEAIGMCDLTDAEWRCVKAFYYGIISHIDQQVGRLRETLRARGFGENTLIVFTSDHGELMGDHHLIFKGTHHDCVTNVPCIVTSPYGAAPASPASSVRAALTQSTDLMPTLLEFAGVPVPPSVQAKSLGPLLADAAATLHNEVFVETVGECYTVRTLHARLTWHGTGEKGELYDLARDPHEFHNLWGEPPAAALQAELMGRLAARLAANHDPLPLKTRIC